MIILATDLDGTLFPNGKIPDDGGLVLLKRVVEIKKLSVIYVTGRNIRQIEEGIAEFDPPLPDYCVAEVGTAIYRRNGGQFEFDAPYHQRLASEFPRWDRREIEAISARLPSLRLQEEHCQNEFKVSFYSSSAASVHVQAAALGAALQKESVGFTSVESVDEEHDVGLIDIMPPGVNKMTGLEFLRRKLGMSTEDIIYAGDSGNDLVPLTGGYRSVLVKNASDKVRRLIGEMASHPKKMGRLYFAGGSMQLSGNYAAGILEGMIHHGALTEAWLKEIKIESNIST